VYLIPGVALSIHEQRGTEAGEKRRREGETGWKGVGSRGRSK